LSSISINPEEFLILVCDDEESVRNVLKEALGNWGFKVVTAHNGEAGLDFLQKNDLPHIVLTDVRMGGMTGLDLAKAAKEISDEIEVVIMTSQGSFDTAVQATKIGVYDYLSKPFDQLSDVKNVIVHVCERIYLRLYNEYLIDELQKKNEQIQNWAEMAAKLSENLDVPQTISIGCEYLSKAFSGAPAIFFQLIPNDRTLLATTRLPETVFGGAQPKFPLAAQKANSFQAIKAVLVDLNDNGDFKSFVEKAEQMSPPDLRTKPGEWRFVAFNTRDLPRGVFAVKTDEWDEAIARRYLTTVETFFENALLHVKVIENSIKDGLTKLYNVRYFKEKFAEELSKSQRISHPISLIFFDIDHFKNFNDKNGHPAGDALLVKMGVILQKQFRTTDIVARYGGEEFVIVMPHTTLVDALAKAEHLRLFIENEKFDHEENQPSGKLTVSIGVSEYPSHASTWESLIKVADDALYEAKKTRNKVCQGKAAQGHVAPFSTARIESTRIS